MALGWHINAGDVERLPFALDESVVKANDIQALRRYQADGDPSGIVIPADATIVEIRCLGLNEAEKAREVRGERGERIPKPARGQRVLADVMRRVDARFNAETSAIDVGRSILSKAFAAVNDANPDDDVTTVQDIYAAVGRSLGTVVSKGDDDEEAAELVGAAALNKMRAALMGEEMAALEGEDKTAVDALNEWEIRSQDGLLATAVMAIEEEGERVEFGEGRTVVDWIQTLKPAHYALLVRAELLQHVTRVTELGKAEARRWSQRSTSRTTTERASPPGVATAVTASDGAFEATAADASESAATG